MKRITAQQHAAIVLNSHAGARGRTDLQYATFAKPGETQADAIKRYMTKLKRDARKSEMRQFPNSSESLASTKAYVEAYYRINFHSEMNGHDGGTPDYVRALFGELSDSPTTWPETDEVLVETID